MSSNLIPGPFFTRSSRSRTASPSPGGELLRDVIACVVKIAGLDAGNIMTSEDMGCEVKSLVRIDIAANGVKILRSIDEDRRKKQKGAIIVCEYL